MAETSRAFRAMGTDVSLIVVHPRTVAPRAAEALADVEALFHQVESLLSRFKSDSELSWLNRSGGRGFAASATLFAVVKAAVAAAEATDGVFDPTVLDMLEAAGYDRSFEHVRDGAGLPPRPRSGATDKHLAPERGRASPASRWHEVRVDPRQRSICLPPQCRLDLGGIAKGWTVDQALDLLRARGFENCAVDAGGDLYAAGVQANGSPWTVGVQDPDSLDHDLLVLQVTDRAVATSSTAVRTWATGLDGGRAHHLIDPRTGIPSSSGVRSATVVTSSVTRGEVLAKSAVILGARRGLEWLNAEPDAEGLLILDRRGTAPSSGLARYAA